ncbi:MAG: CPBP family intramembrane glutamic endopeptidase [Gaiellales bacterium]
MSVGTQPIGWLRGALMGLLTALMELVVVVMAYAAAGLLQLAGAPGWVRTAAACLVLVLATALTLRVMLEVAFVNRRPEWAAFGAARPRRVLRAIAVFIPTVAVGGMLALIVTGLLGLTGTTEVDTNRSSEGFRVFIAVATVLVAPWIEEAAMRGFLYTALERRFGFWWAAAVSGGIWASIHLVAGVLVLFTVVGIALADLRRRTGSILPGVAMHGSWNALAVAFSGGGALVLPVVALLYLSLVLAVRRLDPPPAG